MRKPLIVGQAPAKEGGHLVALDGKSGDRLAGYMGLPGGRAQLLELCETTNLVDRFLGKIGKGDKFDEAEASAKFWRMKRAGDFNERCTVLLGAKVKRACLVGNAYDLVGCEVHCPTWAWRGAVLVIPHPSGINLWWNSYSNELTARRRLREALDGSWRKWWSEG